MTDERFTELLSKKLSEEISAEDDQEFMLMLNENEDYRAEYESLSEYFQPEEQPYENAAMLFKQIRTRIGHPDTDTDPVQITPLKPAKSNFRLWYRIAAVFVFCICSFTAYRAFLSNNSQNRLASNWKKLTSTGRQKSEVVLPDGTHITLNAESELKYPASFNGDTREVYLSGEGFFDVAKDHKHPFIVHTEKMNIRVLGTAFDVKAYRNEPSTETTLLRGRIQITLNNSRGDVILLSPSQKFILTHAAGSIADQPKTLNYTISSLNYFNSGDQNNIVETSWMNNRLTFKNENFAQISLLISRWYGVNMIFKSEEIKNYRFTGEFEKENLTEALKALQFIAPFHYEIKGKTIYLYR